MIRLETASTCSIEECNASFGLRFVKIKPDVGIDEDERWRHFIGNQRVISALVLHH